MARSGSRLFYNVLDGDETQTQANDVTRESPNRISMMAVIGLFALSPILVIFAQPITAYTQAVAKQQFDSKAYIQSVLSKQPVTKGKE
jgi:multicomponent K+:H+ antiporter subunit D